MRLPVLLTVSGFSFVSCVAGRSFLKTRADYNSNELASAVHTGSAVDVLHPRADGARCGTEFGRCPEGTCCSTAGFCGNTTFHCRSPDCQIDYGHCDALQTPGGPPTDSIPRPKWGNVPYGPTAIRSCTKPGMVALTYDDGPGIWTETLLNLLDRYNAKATFFVTGNNNAKGQIDSPDMPWRALIQRMHRTRHQIASHTWSHQDLGKITPEQRRVQLIWNEVAIRNILGGFPTYMRPPYSSCLQDCLDHIGNLGYHIILYDIDTEDYRYDKLNTIQQSMKIFDDNLAKGNASERSWLVIAHDIHEQTVFSLTEHMLRKLQLDGYRAVTVGECLGDPQENWYRKDERVKDSLLLAKDRTKNTDKPKYSEKPKNTGSGRRPNGRPTAGKPKTSEADSTAQVKLYAIGFVLLLTGLLLV